MTGKGKRLPPALAWIPWWLSVIMAIVSYLGLKHLAPHLTATTPGLLKLAGFLPQMAPLAAIGFLLLATILLYDGDDDTDQPDDAPEDQDDRLSDEKND